MEQKKHDILMQLMEHTYVTGTMLARNIKMSSRTVRTLIKEMNALILCQGAHIESSKTTGYHLVIDEQEKFLLFLQEENREEVDIDYNDMNHRLKHLFYLFIQQQDFVKIDDLCDELYLSRTQLKQSIAQVRILFAKYDLHLEHQAHKGMRLVGSEFKKRLCIAHFQEIQGKESTIQAIAQDDTMDTITNIVDSCIRNADYEISDDTMHNLITHLYVALKRMQNHQIVPLDKTMLENLKKESEFEIAQHIMTLMAQIFHISYEEYECGYITIHLCAKRASQHSSLIIADEVITLVDKMLQKVKEETMYDLTHDFHLQMALSQHMVPLIKRIEYEVYMNNPLLDEIKSKLWISYEVSIHACAMIEQSFHCTLPEDEIGYIALHFNVAMQRSQQEIIKRNVLIVCSSGAGSAQLLRYHFINQFQQYIQNLEVCSAQMVNDERLKNFDYVFTTIPLSCKATIPIIQIHHLIDQKDISLIEQKLKGKSNENDVQSYFKESLFFYDEGYSSKEEALQTIVERCKKYYPLPDDYVNEVLQREQIASTEFNERIVFPHATRLIVDETFVSVTILRKGLLWNKHKIRIILFACVEKGKMKQLEDFYQAISKLITNEAFQWRLIEQPRYETLVKILEEMCL